MPAQTEKAGRFLALHHADEPLLMPNPWDRGSARLLASLGFEALATTSSGFAATLGRLDGSGDPRRGHRARAWIAAGTDLPVSADLENCFADDPAGVAETVRLAVGAGLAGCSVEDYANRDEDPIYDHALAAERVAAAAEAAHSGPVHLVLTARAENYLHGRPVPRRHDRPAAELPGGGRRRAVRARRDQAGRDHRAGRVGRPAGQRPRPAGNAPGRRAAPGSASSGSRSAAPSPSSRSARSPRPPRELREHGTYGYWDQARPGSAAARAAFGSLIPACRTRALVQPVPIGPVQQRLQRVGTVVDARVQVTELGEAGGHRGDRESPSARCCRSRPSRSAWIPSPLARPRTEYALAIVWSLAFWL